MQLYPLLSPSSALHLLAALLIPCQPRVPQQVAEYTIVVVVVVRENAKFPLLPTKQKQDGEKFDDSVKRQKPLVSVGYCSCHGVT